MIDLMLIDNYLAVSLWFELQFCNMLVDTFCSWSCTPSCV